MPSLLVPPAAEVTKFGYSDKTEDFIRKNIAGQKTKQAQSRRKMLDKIERLERPEDVWQLAEKIEKVLRT